MSDQFVVMLAILNSKIQEQDETIQYLRKCLDHANETINRQCEVIDQDDDRINKLKDEIASLRHKVSYLEGKIVQYNSPTKPNPPIQSDVANNYMRDHGAALWKSGQKIAVIKEVRQLTNWYLKDTKDWCQDYMGERGHPLV